MNYTERASGLKVLLNIFSFFMIFTIIWGTFRFIEKRNIGGIYNPIFAYSLFVTVYGGYLAIIVSLKKILFSIEQKNPFLSESVHLFKRIGYIILMVGLSDAVANYPTPNNSGIYFLKTAYGSLKPIFFLYLVLSILAFILGDVFRMAMEIKDENDLTI